jgi:hypothetical protein
MKQTENICPCCPNHCSKEKLKCPKGENYFAGGEHSELHHGRHNRFCGEQAISTLSTDDAVVALIRECGHFLHHSRGENADILTANLTSEEKEQLKALLSKCADNLK